MLNNQIPLKKHSHLEDFIDQEVTSLFIIELEDICNFSKNSRLRISSLVMENKHQRWKKRDLIAIQKKSKYMNRAVMKKEKSVQDIDKNEHFSYILPLQIMPMMRQKKKKSIFKLFHLQNKMTENLNLRIKETTSKILRRIQFPSPFLIL